MLNKKVKNTKKITYDNITFKSQLEYNCYLKLKQSNFKVLYEPYRILLFEGFKPEYVKLYLPKKINDNNIKKVIPQVTAIFFK